MKVVNFIIWFQDLRSKSIIVFGIFIVYFIIIFNVGDMFVVDVGDGWIGIFEVKGIEKKSLFK